MGGEDTIIETIPCEICGSSENRLFAHAQDLYSPRIYSVVECVKCGLIYVNPRISNFEEIYRDQKGMLKYFLEREPSDRTAFKLPLSLIEQFKPAGSVFDIGCGSGNFLLQLKEKGYDCCGVELNRDCVKFGREKRGLDIREGTLETADFGGKKFDLITVLSTLEHMGHPLRALVRVKSLLREDGIVIISVPNIRYLPFHIQHALGMQTKTLDPTAHLFYFSPPTLRMMCEKAGLGAIYHECGLVSSVKAENPVKDMIKKIIFPVSNRFAWGSTITIVLKEAK
jgi:2-polyprenyl-3-methyl-5-hydroxy-6-metoxy-1,4-benzoquinol methylase